MDKYNYIKDGVIVHNTLESGEDIIVKDQWKREYHFKIATFPLGTGLMSEAIEVKEDDSVGYKFNNFSDINTDTEIAKEMLIKKIKEEINQRYLRKEGGQLEIGKRYMLCGRIEYNDDLSDTEYERVLVIDGKRITIEEFARLIAPYEGWDFQLKILDE